MLRLERPGWSRVGFLLFEVMVTIAVLSLGLVFVLRSFGSSINAARFSQNYTKATLLAEEKLWDFERVGVITPETPRDGSFPGGFKWSLETSQLEEDSNLNEVRLLICWQEGRREESLSLATYLEVLE